MSVSNKSQKVAESILKFIEYLSKWIHSIKLYNQQCPHLFNEKRNKKMLSSTAVHSSNKQAKKYFMQAVKMKSRIN